MFDPSQKMAQTLRMRQIGLGLAMFVVALIFILWTPSFGESQPHSPPISTTPAAPSSSGQLFGPGYHGRSSPANINRVTNSTLGFSKIFVIGLPERTDKRDAMTLTSSLTGFNLEFIDGVKGEAVPDKAIPFGKSRDTLPNTYLGSWRSHMNAVRRQVFPFVAPRITDWETMIGNGDPPPPPPPPPPPLPIYFYINYFFFIY